MLTIKLRFWNVGHCSQQRLARIATPKIATGGLPYMYGNVCKPGSNRTRAQPCTGQLFAVHRARTLHIVNPHRGGSLAARSMSYILICTKVHCT